MRREWTYDVLKGNGQAIAGFAVVTADAAPSVAQYHNRTPVVLDNAQFDDWMRATPEHAAATMKPDAGEIEAVAAPSFTSVCFPPEGASLTPPEGPPEGQRFEA
jgi:putative SOS response-associated peptidase YedK